MSYRQLILVISCALNLVTAHAEDLALTINHFESKSNSEFEGQVRLATKSVYETPAVASRLVLRDASGYRFFRGYHEEKYTMTAIHEGRALPTVEISAHVFNSLKIALTSSDTDCGAQVVLDSVTGAMKHFADPCSQNDQAEITVPFYTSPSWCNSWRYREGSLCAEGEKAEIVFIQDMTRGFPSKNDRINPAGRIQIVYRGRKLDVQEGRYKLEHDLKADLYKATKESPVMITFQPRTGRIIRFVRTNAGPCQADLFGPKTN